MVLFSTRDKLKDAANVSSKAVFIRESFCTVLLIAKASITASVSWQCVRSTSSRHNTVNRESFEFKVSTRPSRGPSVACDANDAEEALRFFSVSFMCFRRTSSISLPPKSIL